MPAIEPKIKIGIEWKLKETPMGPEHNQCAHRIQTRVARSKGDSTQFFRKSGESTLAY